jgi:hypothetical protein
MTSETPDPITNFLNQQKEIPYHERRLIERRAKDRERYLAKYKGTKHEQQKDVDEHNNP